MNKALRDWCHAEVGRITYLSHHLGLTQPAISKMIVSENPLRLKYAKKLIMLTGLSADLLYPFHHELFKWSLENDKNKVVLEISTKKVEALKVLNDAKRAIEDV